MKKLLGTIGIVAVLGGGAFAISTVLPAGAQTPPPSNSSSSSSSGSSAAPNGKGGGRAEAAKNALDGLVQNGTINQDQENAVIQAMKGALQSGGNGHGRSPRVRVAAGMLKVAADKIGVAPKDLAQARRGGQSIADFATSKNVNPSDVETAIVNAIDQRIGQAVSKGHLSQDKAATLTGKVPQLVDRFVNAKGTAATPAAPNAGSGNSSSSDQSTSSSS